MKQPPALRSALSRLIFAAGAVPVLIAVLLLVFWLTPLLEEQMSQSNQRLAFALAAETEKTLLPPHDALKSLAGRLDDYRRNGHTQVALDTLVASSEVFEAAYIADSRLHIEALAVAGSAQIERHDFLDLDISGSPALAKNRGSNTGIWSDSYRSPISDQSVVAAAIPFGTRLLVGEISLRRLSDFVSRHAGEQSTPFILDRRFAIVAHPDPTLAAQQANFSHLPLFRPDEKTSTARFRLDHNEVIGSRVAIPALGWNVVVTQPLAAVHRPIWITTLTLTGLAVFGTLLSWWFGTLIAGRVADRFGRLATLSEQLAAGAYPDQWPRQNLAEAERLNESMRRMSDAIREREQALRELNQTLEEKVFERTASLSEAQATLVRSEKLAALGSLVAGIAHELNTPIGNGLMAATALQDKTREFSAAASGGLRRSELTDFITYSTEVADLVVRNLNRAASLIGSFKQVAVDQTTYQRRRFDLAELIEEITTTLIPALRKSRCEIVPELAPQVVMDSFPGPLGQVLINLISNAIHHGYEESGGAIRVRAVPLPDQRVEIVVSDQGRGIPEENLSRIFDPFFTTRMGKGGSGLGLHICYNIITSLLGGSIDVSSIPGRGARFTIVLPCTAPLESRSEEMTES